PPSLGTHWISYTEPLRFGMEVKSLSMPRRADPGVKRGKLRPAEASAQPDQRFLGFRKPRLQPDTSFAGNKHCLCGRDRKSHRSHNQLLSLPPARCRAEHVAVEYIHREFQESHLAGSCG